MGLKDRIGEPWGLSSRNYLLDVFVAGQRDDGMACRAQFVERKSALTHQSPLVERAIRVEVLKRNHGQATVIQTNRPSPLMHVDNRSANPRARIHCRKVL